MVQRWGCWVTGDLNTPEQSEKRLLERIPMPPFTLIFTPGRPVDILEMPDGALLVSDDYSGAVTRIVYTG